MERPEVVDPLKEEEQPILQQTPVEKPEPIDTQTDDAFSVRGLAEKRLGKLGTGALDFVPIAGDILAAGDVVESYKKGDVLGTAINSAAFAVGLIPVVGDVAAKGLKAGLKATRAEKSDVPDIWSYPEQMYSSSGTSQNQIAAGYNELKRRGELKKGDKVVDIGGGRFDNLINDASEEGIDVKVFDPFNRTPEHNAAVADAVREGQADVAMSHNVLNVIKEDANIKTVIQQAENAVKPGGKAHFTVYEGNRSGVGGTTKAKTKTQTDQSFQRNQKTEDYVPFVEEIFGANNVTRKGKIITAVKRIVFDFKSPKGTVFKRGGKFGGLNFPVGKVIGGNQVYFHKNYIGSQPKEVQDLYNSALDKLPPDHNFNTLMYMKGKGDTPDTIRFDESADFDFAREPTPGKMVAIDANGNVANRSSNQIFHHKWMWVGDDYKGFDVNKEYNWSKQWTSKVDNFSGIGKKENWDRILEEKGLEVEGYREALPSGGAATIDFPFERKPHPSEKYTTQVSAPYDFEVEKTLSDWNRGKLKPSQVKKVLERKGLDADLREAGKYNSVDVFPARKFLKENELGKPETYEFFKGGQVKTYKEGGVVPMQEQMKFAFMNEGGVLADDGVERDPVSGNEVPAGSMAEEVRDDVPAMLSEGEYVVPADVVRYHGIDKFEELRDEAKMGLARMEADGRIGGQPVEEQEEFPFPVEELEGFQEGGVVGDTYSSVTGSEFKANQPYGAGGGRFPGVGFELRNFTNPKTGRTVVIPFFNGKSMQYIPPDFLEGGATTTRGGTFDPAADERSRQEDEAERARQGGQTGLTPLAQEVVNKVIAGESTGQQGKSFDQYTSDDWNRYIKNADSLTANVTSKLPVVGLLQRMNERAARSFAEKALRSGVNPATEEPLSSEEKLTLQRVMMVAPNTSMTEALINAVTGKGETIQGVPLFEQKGFETDLLPDMSRFKEQDTTKPQDQPQTQDVSNLYGRGFTPEQIGEAPVQVQDGTATQSSSGFNLDSALFSAAEASMPKGRNIPFTQTKMKGYDEIKESGTKQDYENLFQRIVVAEAGNEDLIGQALVARAILNRKGVLDDNFSPSTFYTNSSDLVDIIYGGTAESGVDKLLGGNVQKAIQQGKGYQFEPVGKGIITDPNRFNTANMTEAASAIALAQNPTKLKQELRKRGYKPEQIKNLVASTGFANLETQEARGVKDDKTQDVNRVKYGRHTFNTAGNEAKKVYNPNPYENTLDQGAPTFAGVPLTSPFQTGQAVAGQAETQPLQQTFVPPQAPTAEQIRLAGGVDAFVKSQLPTGTEQITTELQDLPVGVSIEADGQFTGTGGLGDPNMLGTARGAVDPRRADIQSRLAKSREPKPATMFRGLGAEYDRAKEQANLATLQKSIQRTGELKPPSLDDQMAAITDIIPAAPERLVLRQQPPISAGGMEGRLPQIGPTAPQPVAPFTPLGRPSDISRLMPTTADVQAQQAADARKAREEQERMIYEETQKRIPTTTQTDDQPDTPELRDLKQRAQTRDAAKKSRQMNQARQDVIMGGGSAFEADAAAQAVFLDQSDEIRRNQELNKGKTLTQVLQEEESREEESSGGGGFGGGDTGGSDKSIVCTEIYRQTQLPNWSKAMRVWDTYQRRYLTPEHEIGYHWLFKPYVSGMKKSNLLTRFGALMAGRRTQHLKHVLTKGKAKDDLFGNVFCKIIHPTVYVAGKIKTFLDSKTKAT